MTMGTLLTPDEVAQIRERLERAQARLRDLLGDDLLTAAGTSPVTSDMLALLDSAEAAAARWQRALPILRAVADTPVDTAGYGGLVCLCAYRQARPTDHLPDCLCAEARALLTADAAQEGDESQ